ncbi:uncharacterized protein LOC131057365 isoform X2 [Cryptomeria japonica]|uniref:uncharacterized protein LOC131057365 isoform X2 n=1 Tax=Cryptomeria japonica TaxID=3369 RepID=UPI0027DAAC35|nr:uncharacterized protein LOC131057365 isoform X2 [Cryptomeria japonica]
MAKIGAGSSPRSVLGPWEMDAQGRLPMAGKRNCVIGKGILEENKDYFGNQGFFEINGLSESKKFSENLCLLENKGCSEKSRLFENKGLSGNFGLLENKEFLEKSGLFESQKLPEFENKVFSEKNGGNEGFSENNGILDKVVFSGRSNGNEGFSRNKGILESKGFLENTGIFANKGTSGSKGISENKGVSESTDFSRSRNLSEIKGFFENEAFSRRGGLFVNKGSSGSEKFCGHEGFSENNGFSMKGFKLVGMEDDPELKRKIGGRRMGVSRGKHVKEDIIKVSGNESFSEDKVLSKSGHRFGAAEDEHELKRNGYRRYMGISRVKCVNEEGIGFFRVLAASFGECDGGFWGKRRKKVEEEKDNYSDPLVVLGSDIMLLILHRLDARSLAQSILVSHGWQALAACDSLWAKKTRIMKEDLCNHVWEFRFKTPAPLYWLNLDPSWKGTGPPMRRYFHPDGSQTADPTDRVWGGHECTYSIVTFTDQGKIREHYVRINRWPRMSVSRKQDWGWELDNHVYCYSSIPDADKEGGTGPLNPFW